MDIALKYATFAIRYILIKLNLLSLNQLDKTITILHHGKISWCRTLLYSILIVLFLKQ